jgi:hypothetical protein
VVAFAPIGFQDTQDCETLRADLATRFPSRYFIPTDENAVNDEQWLRFASHLAGKDSLVESEGVATLGLFANQLSILAEGVSAPILLGIQKKGMSILFELLQRRSNLRKFDWCSNVRHRGLNVRDRNVIVVDDCTHRGEKAGKICAALQAEHVASLSYLTVVATELGATAVRFRGGAIRSLVEVAPQRFEAVKQTILIPALNNLRDGALANRLGAYLLVDGARISLYAQIRTLLESMLEVAGVESIAEILQTSKQNSTFHGNLEFDAAYRERFTESLRARDPGFRRLTEAKVRFFLRAEAPLRLYLVSIVHFRSKSRSPNREEIERSASAEMLEGLAAALTQAGTLHGLRLRTTDPRFPEEFTSAELETLCSGN